MNIHELDSYNLGDAVKFNNKLNPRIWDADEKMRPEVREQLLRIADDFREFLGIDVELKDITVSGSNAAFTYTPHSDIDLHLVVDLPEADRNQVYRELFDAKKYAYNEQHDIKIGGYDVELYVQDANKPHHSQGIYSLTNNDWVSVPKRRQPDVDDISVKSKFEDLGHRIESAIKSQDYEKISAMANKIKDYRQAGLDAHGEFGPENLAFKILRKQGLIQKLYDARNAAKDELLSLDERKKKKKRKSVKYGYGGYWYPGYAYAGQDHPAGTEGGDGGGDGGGESVKEDAGMTWDGVNPTTDMFTSEDATMTWDGVNPSTAMFTTETQDPTNEEILKDFVEFCVKELKIEQMPRVKLRRDPQWPAMHRTFGRYNDENKTLEVAWGQRHIMDVLRTVAHELTHKHQHEREGDKMGADAGETGSPYENEANARAGVLMRDYGRMHPEYFTVEQAHDLEEANPAQQLSLYKPDGTTYRGEKMPGYDPDDFHSETNPKTRIDRLTHQDLSNRTATDLVDPIERAEQNIDKERLKDAIRASMSSLTSRETAVLNMRFWKDLTLAQTAKALNSSAERIRQIEAKALRKLRHESRSDRLEPFVKEGASGYIPTRAQAKDPRYSMALTVDIKPGQVGKEANKLKLKTDRQGHPQIARANGLFENLFKEYKQYKINEFAASPDRDDNDDVPDQLLVLANRWWNATDKQPQIEHVLNSLGWSIHQVESEDDAVQLQHRDGTTHFISADDFDPDLFESEELDEVNMSPGALEKFATSKEAQGIRAGFEAELIFRDTTSDDEDEEMEPDYDYDERAYSIQQVIEFFSNDDWGYGISDRQRRSLEDELDETYMNWRDEQMTEDFKNEAEDLVREVYLNETPMGERIIKVLTDGMEIDDAEADKILAVGVDAPRFTKSSEQAAYAEQNPAYKIYLEAENDADAILDEEVETSISKQDGYYDQALDDFRDNYSGDDDSFFSDVDLRWMSDIANNYNLDWPYWTGGSSSNNGSRDWDEIGAELQQVVGMPVKVSSNYHSTPRKEGQWIIEPDGSLDPDDKSEEAGLEIVSPPMPLLMAIAKLKEVTDWANDPNGGNAYTNRSTGLHMGVSLPVRGGDVDYVKLILFMGDKYVLDTFGREANSFTASALNKLQQNIKGGKSDPAGVVELLRHGLTELAFKELQKGVGTSKYTSAHLQNGYIEFRSPGGDWLAKADEEIGILENTMMRFARAMQIAGDPGADRQEYAKKLYKLVTTDNEQYTDQLRLFSQFAAGELSAEQLKKRWAEKAIGTERKTNQRWKLYQKSNGTWTPVPGGEWNGYTEDQVKNAVWSKYGREALDSGEYQLVNMGEQEWEVYDVKTGKTLEIVKGKSKGEVADTVFDKYANQGIGFNVRPYEDPAKLTPRAKLAKRITTKKIDYNYDIVDRRTVDLKVVDRFYATDDKDASETFDRWLKSKGLPSDEDAYGYRKGRQAADDQRDSVDIQRRLGVQDVDTDVAQNFTQPQDATDIPRNWEFVDRITGRIIHNMSNASYNQANVVQDNLETRYPNADIYLRSVAQNVAGDYSAYERNSDRIDAIRAQARQPRQNYELVSDEDPDRVIHRMNDATADEVRAWIAQQEQGGMPAGFLRTRIVAEAIDPISGAGAMPPRQDPKNTGKKAVTPAEKVFKNPVKGQPYRSAIGQAISQRDLENMTQQIKMARKLGDSVMEMEETPPEVLRALDQAAQKNGYRNWADVKANPRSEHAVMNVAKLANNIMKTAGPHHEKLFYKSKTDENFADGKNPGRKGLSRRVGIPKKATLGQLEKIAKSSTGERRKMAQWQLNMRRGKAKKK
jgi:RNA polymerase sigma factor (sigma-70 family)